jgi:hypothetical protein
LLIERNCASATAELELARGRVLVDGVCDLDRAILRIRVVAMVIVMEQHRAPILYAPPESEDVRCDAIVGVVAIDEHDVKLSRELPDYGR